MTAKNTVVIRKEPGGTGPVFFGTIDSLSSLEAPAIGYGIRYEFDIFKQAIQDGWQVEYTDIWLQFGFYWPRSVLQRRPHLFSPYMNSLLTGDEDMLLADYQSYIDCQDQVDEASKNQEHWTRMSILIVTRMEKFSSDRAIREYYKEILNAKPVSISLGE